jgi:hypothetical protein
MPEAYLAMVEENEIRVGLSFYERARIVARAAEAGVFERHRGAAARSSPRPRGRAGPRSARSCASCANWMPRCAFPPRSPSGWACAVGGAAEDADLPRPDRRRPLRPFRARNGFVAVLASSGGGVIPG